MRSEQEIKDRINLLADSLNRSTGADLTKVVAIRELEWVLGHRDKP